MCLHPNSQKNFMQFGALQLRADVYPCYIEFFVDLSHRGHGTGQGALAARASKSIGVYRSDARTFCGATIVKPAPPRTSMCHATSRDREKCDGDVCICHRRGLRFC